MSFSGLKTGHMERIEANRSAEAGTDFGKRVLREHRSEENAKAPFRFAQREGPEGFQSATSDSEAVALLVVSTPAEPVAKQKEGAWAPAW